MVGKKRVWVWGLDDVPSSPTMYVVRWRPRLPIVPSYQFSRHIPVRSWHDIDAWYVLGFAVEEIL